jgi:hypothetical protein
MPRKDNAGDLEDDCADSVFLCYHFTEYPPAQKGPICPHASNNSLYLVWFGFRLYQPDLALSGVRCLTGPCMQTDLGHVPITLGGRTGHCMEAAVLDESKRVQGCVIRTSKTGAP